MWNIAFNTYRELIRSRALLIALFFGMVAVIITPFLKTLSLGQTTYIIPHFSYSFFEWCLLILTLFLGNSLLAKEIETRTIYLLLSKPVSRSSIVLGKFFGCIGMIFTAGFLMASIIAGVFYFSGVSFELFPWIISSIFLKICTVWAILLCISTFTSPFVALFVTISIYIASHGIFVLLDLGRNPLYSTYNTLATGISYFLPNFESLAQIKELIGYTEGIPPTKILLSFFLPSFLYMIIYLFLGSLIFQKRKFQ